ncbi:SDR family oxidoreductase [Rufibacter sediminis]|uniref:SDR family oxidoreductase n=1 Tax=Rufibacter sediminis TaxID=2762756 RepID=A0ABR6VYD4_9BACT|nr:SDR family oxidoreductase [Rufibacter sediminis]MBC3541656.1 SDR family oxidoreductase [Rufibacter sediminis]
MRKKTISVLGCGWLGLPLAQELVQLGYQVKGSTTTPAKMDVLREKGIEPFLLSFPENSPKTDLVDFLASEVLVFNLPPSRSSSEAASYEQMLQSVLEALPPSLTSLLFISSTSVYPDVNREVTESDALARPDAASLMLRCEYLIQQARPQATVVRFGGLMGGTRHPGKFLAGKKEVPQPDAPVNMIHLSDCVGILVSILELEKWGVTFNACAPQHPSRKEFYTRAAEQLGLEPPVFAAQGTLNYKRISPALLSEELHYTFRYPDPLACLSSPDF